MLSDPRKGLIVFGSLLWKPFETRFSDFLEDLKFYTEMTQDELVIYQLAVLQEERTWVQQEALHSAKERLQAADKHRLLKETRILAEAIDRTLEKQNAGEMDSWRQNAIFVY